MKNIAKIMLQFIDINKTRDNETGRTPFPVGARVVRTPFVLLYQLEQYDRTH